jgi:hypothetical protein
LHRRSLLTIIGYFADKRVESTKVRCGYDPAMRYRRVPGLASAATLAVVTLTVFATFQNYGPESAVRRFHHGVQSGDEAEIAQVVATAPDTSAVKDLRKFVTAVLSAGGPSYRIVKSDRTTTQVDMLAIYDGRPPIVWVVIKVRDGWKIDPYLTLQGLRRLGYQ